MTTQERLFMKHYDELSREIMIDLDLCHYCNIAHDGWHRLLVTPFSVGCLIYNIIRYNLASPEGALKAVINKWDSIKWTSTPINIGIWNKLFSDKNLTASEWAKIQMPLDKIDSIHTTLTSSAKHVCYPVFMGDSRAKDNVLLIVSEESYHKTLNQKTASKLTVYPYERSGNYVDLLEGLRLDTLRVIIDF